MSLLEPAHLLLISVVTGIVIVVVMFSTYVYNLVNKERQERYFVSLQKQYGDMRTACQTLHTELSEIKVYLGGVEQQVLAIMKFLTADKDR